jgi:hypothetical protein
VASVTSTTAPSGSGVTTTTSPLVGSEDVTTTTVLSQTIVTVPDDEPTPQTDPRWPVNPGRGQVVVDGEVIDVEVFIVDPTLAAVPPEERTQEQIDAIRQVGDDMLDIVRGAMPEGSTLPVSIRYTDTGAVFLGLVIDPATGLSVEIPVEDVALLFGGGLVIMVGGLTADGQPEGVEFDGVLQFGQGGWIAVLGFGLEPVAPGQVIVMSTPRLLGRFETDVEGAAAIQTRIPDDLPVGGHTAVVSVGGDTASIGFRVAGGALPVTGIDSDRRVQWMVLLMSAGGLMVLIDRRRLTRA